jgi:hypothetical protein
MYKVLNAMAAYKKLRKTLSFYYLEKSRERHTNEEL